MILSIATYINERVHIPTGNLGIERKDMPQIFSGDIQSYIKFIRLNGVKVVKQKVLAKSLKPTQNEINTDKVKKMLTAPDEVLRKIIIVSKDGYVLDGHHRWLALINKDDKAYIPVWRVDINMQELLAMTHKFDKVEYKNLSEGFIGDVYVKAMGKKKLFFQKLKFLPQHLAIERSETYDMVRVFFHMLRHKLNKGGKPSDRAIASAMEQLRDLGKFAIIAPLLMMPGGTTTTVTLELIANELGMSILPSELSLREAIEREL